MKIKNEKKMKIFMFGVGFVVVSDDYDENHNELNINCVKINSGATIRNWGTENGIGELVERGPLTNTVLDGLLTECSIPKEVIWIMLNVSNTAEKSFKKEIEKSFRKVMKK